jgi:AbrB family looped-hinge helix DNA binding protein
MRTTIDAAGRLVIPQAIRREAGLRPGAEVDVRLVDGRIEIELATAPVRLERRGRLVVAVVPEEVGPLSAEVVETTRAELRRERA